MWHVAQLNVARATAPLDSPALAEFMAALDGVNALADAAPGFVWRLQSDSGNATDVRLWGDPLLIANMSVWSSIDALFDFVYRTAHNAVMIRRREWFERPAEAHQVLWWIPAGHTPQLGEGLERLAHLRAHGPSAHAFTFKQRFPSETPAPISARPSDDSPASR
jgi:hypothetical protein